MNDQVVSEANVLEKEVRADGTVWVDGKPLRDANGDIIVDGKVKADAEAKAEA